MGSGRLALRDVRGGALEKYWRSLCGGPTSSSPVDNAGLNDSEHAADTTCRSGAPRTKRPPDPFRGCGEDGMMRGRR